MVMMALGQLPGTAARDDAELFPAVVFVHRGPVWGGGWVRSVGLSPALWIGLILAPPGRVACEPGVWSSELQRNLEGRCGEL